MLRVAILARHPVAGEAIAQMVEDTTIFRLVYRVSPIPKLLAVIGLITPANPDIILLELGDWEFTADLARHLRQTMPRTAIVGFLDSWTPEEQSRYEAAGVTALLAAPFSTAELEAAAYRAVHRQRPIANTNILAFLPAKAGSGSSTVALNTAAALANGLTTSTLLIETDRRSGVLSIQLNAEDRAYLSEVLAQAGELTGLIWNKQLVTIGKLDMLLANPSKPGPLPTWVNYYHLLAFAEKRYQYVLADLPEVINPATAEIVRAARAVFIVCEPELASLKLAALRRADLENCEIPPGKIRILVNRWERGRVKEADVEDAVGGPIFATLPNDYREIKNAALESRLVARDSAFGKACVELARSFATLQETSHQPANLGLLKRLSKLAW